MPVGRSDLARCITNSQSTTNAPPAMLSQHRAAIMPRAGTVVKNPNRPNRGPSWTLCWSSMGSALDSTTPESLPRCCLSQSLVSAITTPSPPLGLNCGCRCFCSVESSPLQVDNKYRKLGQRDFREAYPQSRFAENDRFPEVCHDVSR